MHRQAGTQSSRPRFHPQLVPTVHCGHNPLDYFRGSQLSARLPLFFRALCWHHCQGYVLAGSVTLASAHLWEVTKRETRPMIEKGSWSFCLIERRTLQGKCAPGIRCSLNNDQHLPKTAMSPSIFSEIRMPAGAGTCQPSGDPWKLLFVQLEKRKGQRAPCLY